MLWWLLRVTPPAPRREVFPAVRLLLGLNATEETPARTPWWLLALRMAAAGLVIVALARPVLDAGAALAGKGPVLLVIDNGWAAAADWARRKEAAGVLLDRAERAGRKVGPAGDRAGWQRRAGRGHRAPCRWRICARGWRRCSRSPGRPTAPRPPARRLA